MDTEPANADFIPPEVFHDLDTQGLRCPEPVMMLHAAVRQHAPGDFVRVLATDPATERDIPRFCRFLGHTLRATETDDDCLIYWIQIAGSRGRD